MPRAKGLWSRLRGLQGLRDHLGLARARGRQPAAGEKNPVINELFLCAFVCVFFIASANPVINECIFGALLCLCQRSLFIASAALFGVLIS